MGGIVINWKWLFMKVIDYKSTKLWIDKNQVTEIRWLKINQAQQPSYACMGLETYIVLFFSFLFQLNLT